MCTGLIVTPFYVKESIVIIIVFMNNRLWTGAWLMVYTELSPKCQQVHVAPVLNSAVTTSVDIQNDCQSFRVAYDWSAVCLLGNRE